MTPRLQLHVARLAVRGCVRHECPTCRSLVGGSPIVAPGAPLGGVGSMIQGGGLNAGWLATTPCEGILAPALNPHLRSMRWNALLHCPPPSYH